MSTHHVHVVPHPQDRRVTGVVEVLSGAAGNCSGEGVDPAVDQVAEHERRDDQYAGQQHPLREEHQRSGAHAEGADERHGVGAHPEANEQVGDRRDDLGPEGAETFEHGGSRLPVRAGSTAATPRVRA